MLRLVRTLFGRGRRWPNVLAEEGVVFSGCGFMGPVRIGYRSYANDSFFRNCEIGRYCSIGRRASIGAAKHDVTALSTHPDFAPQGFDIGPVTRIGNDVWIGDNAIIMAGLSIGDGAVVGAGAVVTRDVAAYDIVAGAPALRIRSRFDPEAVARLLASQWWLYGDAMIAPARTRHGPDALADAGLERADAMAAHHRPMLRKPPRGCA